ncbi:MAG: hypothetical protein ACOVKC_10190 [Brevundimonas sp.]
MTTFSGERGVNIYRATVIASALRLYAKTKMQMNRAYTPTAMLRAAADITGKTFKRGQYVEAADALKAWADEQAPIARANNEITA